VRLDGDTRPKEYPRLSDRYYAPFVEDDNGIRIEFMHNPPRETTADYRGHVAR
jgi:hypothetical protein